MKKQALLRLGRGGDSQHTVYLHGQLNKTTRKLEKDASFRYGVMIEALKRSGVEDMKGVLCVGCRNAYELDAFESAGFTDVKGIDLVSTDKRIMVMDMERMNFKDNSFSLVYSGDSLEHAYELEQAVAEFCRVTKSGGLIAIEMPIKYETGHVDRWDVGSVGGLRTLFVPHTKELKLVWQEEQPDRLRVIWRVVK